jgi:hypothetical protein
MTGPNFYTIDFAREVVLQGRSSTFINIGRVESELAPVAPFSIPDDVYIIIFPSARNFDSFASVSALTGTSSGSYALNVGITGTFPAADVLGFNNMEPGMDVKNSYTFMPYGPTIGPVTVDAVTKNVGNPDYYVNLTSGIVGSPPIVLGPTAIHIGNWNEDGDHWKLNGKKISEYQKIALAVPPSVSEVSLQNVFDGTVENFPAGLLEGTGYVGRNPVSGWAKLTYDANIPNKSMTFRIDYDGSKNTHLKFNFIIFKRNSGQAFAPLNYKTPDYMPEGATGVNNATDGTYFGTPFGPKSGKPSAPNTGAISTTVDYQEVHFFGYTETDARTSRTTYQNSYTSETKLYDDRSSYGLLKTNPKISGNVKITLDSKGELWLNSIDANNELADSSYKKYPISSLSTYSRDLYKFFKNGQTPPSVIFDLYQVDNQYQNTKRTLSEQYDNFYNYGVEQLKNRYYDENFSFFAPIWLRKTVPDFFVIFRLDHPVAIDSYVASLTNEEFFNSYFKDARIVKTFDMREKSKLGSYLRKIVNDPRFKERPLDVSFESDTPTVWNGACYGDGTMSGKGEFLSDYWKIDRPITDLEEYITGGYQRHGIISTNLINLEFLFDDEEATPYSINRYFGLYVTENQLANFQIDPIALPKIQGQTPLPKKDVDGEPYSTKPFIQTNPNGIEIPVNYYHNVSGNLVNNTNVPSYQGEVVGKFPLPEFIEDPLRIFYVKDRDDAFKRIVKLSEVDYGNPGTLDYRRVSQIKLFDTQEDISKYAGANQITSQFTSTLLDTGKSQMVLKLSANDSDPVFADQEVIELTFNQYNNDPRLHEYYVKASSVSASAVTFQIFKDLHTEKLLSSFTMPQVGGSVTGFAVTDASKFSVGQQIYVTGAGYFEITSSTLTGNLISFKNLGNPQNVSPMSAVTAVNFISVGGPSYISTYTYTPLTNELNIDPLLTLIISQPVSGYAVSNMYKISVQDTNIIITRLSGLKNLNAKLRDAFQQFRWKMVANSIGLQPGDSWDYPVADPNGYDYLTTFSNEGSPSKVATALSLAINSFENRPCDALAIDDTIYLQAKKAGTEGNAIQLTRRMIDQQSNAFNLSFYERGNTAIDYTLTNIEYPGYTPASVNIELKNKTGKVGTDYTYIKILKAPTGSYFEIRTEVNPASLATAASTGSGVYFVTTPTVDIFTNPTIPFSIDISNLPNYVFQEYVIKVAVGPLESTQLFIGGNNRKRSRAKIAYTDSQRYFNDRRIKRTGDIITGSNIISNVTLDNLFVGAKVEGTGIPTNSYITFINTLNSSVTISNEATLGTNLIPYTSSITFDELSILNNQTIKDQWYQTQKGTYTPMMPWNVQGKYVYSLPYLDEPTYDRKNKVIGYTDLGSFSSIQLEDTSKEFYQTYDKKIVAYDIYRPIVGIFSIFPIKDFDFDFYFSDYSYTPILEALRYYFNEEVEVGQSMLLPVDENYKISLVDAGGTPLTAKVPLTIEGLNPNTKQWDYLETLEFGGPVPLVNDENSIILNTYYPYYVYDIFEQPQKWDDGIAITANGLGLRNYMKRVISSKDIDGNVSESQPLLYRLTMGTTIPADPDAKIKIVKNDYDKDKDLEGFPGFAAITDIYSPEDAQAVRSLLDDSKYVEAFLYQALRSEYDRLRENFNKEYALKSKVVPYINKWVQEGTDARDNYYRLNTSRAFGISNFSPDSNVNFAEPSLLTNEFPYLDTVPKDYPVESLEGSRSYMFAKLDDIATGTSSWHDLLTGNDDDDWFSKYFSLGYPTEKDQYGNLVTKSRDERYTFFTYNDGIKKSQSLFRGAKVQVLDINDQLIPPTEITESTKYNLYKFAAIARIIAPTPYTKEKPVDIEVYRNDKFKSITMIINVHVQDYRVQAGLSDYLFFYAVNDQLKNYNQKQVSLENVVGTQSLGGHSTIGITDFWPYTWNHSYSGFNDYVSNTYTDLAVLRPRQGFFGGGYLELGDTRLGGLAIELNSTYKPAFVGGKLVLQYKSVDATYDNVSNSYVSNGYEFSVLDEITPTQDNYTDTSNAFTFAGSDLAIQPSSFTIGGSLYKLINAVQLNASIKHVDRSNARLTTDQYLPLQTVFSGTNKPFRSSIVPGALTLNEFLVSSGALQTTGSGLEEIETYNIKGGTSAYAHIKNLLTYASILSFVNSDSPFIEYYKVEGNTKTTVSDYKLRFVPQDQIVKTGILSYVNDEDKPIEYVSAPLIGYNIVNTNQNEVVYRHRGLYEPRAIDILTFWVREDEAFTKHFNKDYLLFNTHLNNKSGLSGIIRNYGINKVADAEILQIPGGGAYKSVYPLIGEVSIDNKDLFILNSTWDKNYYRRYYNLTSWNDIDGIEEMKEYKSFMGSKAMNVPKSQILDTFNSTEATYIVTEPSQVVGVPSLSTTEYSLTDVAGNTKPILTIDLNLQARLLRKLYEDLALSTSFDEFTWLTTLGITEFQSLTSTDIERLKTEYLTKNIIQLYEIDEVKLYALSQEGLPIFDIEITDADKIAAGYRVDKDCKVVNTSQFGIKITKVLDTKKPYGYAVSATIKRI